MRQFIFRDSLFMAAAYLRVTELVALEVQVAFATQGMRDETDAEVMSIKNRISAASRSHRIILCSASPRATTGVYGERSDMFVYISLSMSQNASVLSPTSAWSWLSAYAMLFSP